MIRRYLLILGIFTLGGISHVAWVYANEVALKVAACDYLRCVQVAEVQMNLPEKVKPPALPVQPKKGN